MTTLFDIAHTDGEPPGSPTRNAGGGEPHAVAGVPDHLQPVLQLLTQGLNMHATQIDALARAVARMERGAVQQAETTELARAEAERRAAETYARAEAAERHADAKVAASEARTTAAMEALSLRVAELEGRLDAVPPALDELRGRSEHHALTLGVHERELSACAAEIGEGREALAQLAGKVELCAVASALAAAEASLHASVSTIREELAEASQRQRRHAMQTASHQELLDRQQALLSETLQTVSGLEKGAAEAASEGERMQLQLRDLAAEHKQLEKAQSQTTDTVQLGLARAVASAEATRNDADKIAAALAELEGWSRRLERLEVDLSAAERRVDGAAEEMRRQAANLEGSQRTSMLSATQQVCVGWYIYLALPLAWRRHHLGFCRPSLLPDPAALPSLVALRWRCTSRRSRAT